MFSFIQDFPIHRVQQTLMLRFTQPQLHTHSTQGKEPQPKIQHRDVSIADYHIAPGPKQLKRCNYMLRALSPTDNLGSIPQVFQALDETFFNGRVGKVARAVGVRNKTEYTEGVGGYSFREGGRLVIRIPTWEGKTSTLRDDLNILFREMTYLDFYEINACQCEECPCSDRLKIYAQFVEYLTRLDKLANLHLEGFQKQWNIRENDDFDVISRLFVDKASQEKATQTSEAWAEIAFLRDQVDGLTDQVDDLTDQVDGLTCQVDDLRDQVNQCESPCRGVLASTAVVEAPQRRKSCFV